MKKLFTNVISIILTLIMLVSVISGTFSVYATDIKILVDSGDHSDNVYNSKYDNSNFSINFTYEILNDGTARIINSGVYADLYTITIPETIDGHVVSTIGANSFMDGFVHDLREIIIPESVINIEDGAFQYCEILSHVGYKGSQAQWSEMFIGKNNERLTTVKHLHFEFDYEKDKTVTENIIQPACYEGGLEEICSCGHSLIIETIPEIYDYCHFTNYIYNNDATEYLDGTKTAYCDYDYCRRTHTLKEINTAINPTIIDIYPGKTEKVMLMPETGIIFRIHATYSVNEGFWFSLKYPKELTPVFNENYWNNLPIRWLDYYDELEYGVLDGGMGDCLEGEELFSPHTSIAGQTYYIEVVSQHHETIEISLSMSGCCASEHPSEAHTLGEWEYDWDNGIRTRGCELCDFSETEVLEKTESGDVEIIAPENPDFDFDIDNIEGNSEQFIVIEETVTDNIGTEWEVLKAFDITLKNNDGVHVQPDGTVKVKLPLDWEKDGNYKVYRVNEDGTLTDMNAYRQGSHVVFETDHFSVYVIVEENTEDTPSEPELPSDDCSHMCHKTGFMGFIWKIINFFQKLFRISPVCDCGVAHY